jgi:hypothetical protein
VEELQVPTRPVPVDIYGVDGRRLAGSLFLVESEYNADQRQGIVRLLNDERAFLPFQVDAEGASSEHSVLLNKKHIVRVRLGDVCTCAEDAIDEASLESGPTAALTLTDGSRVAGEIMIETPWSLSRLVDKMNHDQRFIPIRCDHGLVAVQRSHVVRVD